MPEELLPALRQYRGNNRDGFVFGFDQGEVIKLVEDLKSNALIWHDAFKDQPDCNHFTGSSESVIVVRDCGTGTLESYAVTTYRKEGWGKGCYWLHQEDHGYRVTKWAYLGCSKDIVIKNA